MLISPIVSYHREESRRCLYRSRSYSSSVKCHGTAAAAVSDWEDEWNGVCGGVTDVTSHSTQRQQQRCRAERQPSIETARRGRHRGNTGARHAAGRPAPIHFLLIVLRQMRYGFHRPPAVTLWSATRPDCTTIIIIIIIFISRLPERHKSTEL